MADETRDVKVNLSVDVGREGDAAIRSLEESAKRAGDALGKAAGAASSGPSKPVKPSPIAGPTPTPPGPYVGPVKPPKSAAEAVADGSKQIRDLADSAKKLADATKPGTRGVYGFADPPDPMTSKARAAAQSLPESVRGPGGFDFGQLTREATRAATTAAVNAPGPRGQRRRDHEDVRPIGLAEESTAKALRNLQMGGFMNRVGTVQAYGQGLSEFGLPGGSLLQRGALPIAAAGALGSAGLQTARILQDPYSTGTQMGRSFLRDVVPGGSTALSISDTVTGRAAEMEKAKVGGEVGGIRAGTRAELEAFRAQHNVQQAGLTSRAESFGRSRAVLPPDMARDSAAGERAFREESRLYPLRVQAARAEREATAASRERLAADQEMNKLASRGKDLDSERLKLTKALRDEDSGPGRERILRGLQVSEQEIQANQQAQRQAIQTRAEARNRETGARADVARNQAAQFGAQAENLEERAARSAGGARSLGMMNPLERRQAAMAVEAAQQFGLDALPPELKALAAQIAPETVGKQAEKLGAGTDEFKRLSAVAPADFAGDPEKLRQEAAEMRRKQAEKEFDADKMVATTAASVGKDMAKAVESVIKTIGESFERTLFNNLKIGRNAT